MLFLPPPEQDAHPPCAKGHNLPAPLASLKILHGSNTDHEGADPVLLLRALYTSPIFITARQAKSSAAR